MAKRFSDIRILSELTIDAAGTAADSKAIPFHAHPAYSGGKLYLDGWDLPVIVNLATTRVRDNGPVLKGHDQSKRLGDIISHTLTPKQLDIDGVFTNFESFFLQEILNTHRRGSKWQISIGLGGQEIDPNNITFIPKETKVMINEVLQEGPFYIVDNIEIAECSIVSSGGDRDNPNFITIEASGLPTMERDRTMPTLEQFIVEQGLSKEWLDSKNQDAIWKLYEEHHIKLQQDKDAADAKQKADAEAAAKKKAEEDAAKAATPQPAPPAPAPAPAPQPPAPPQPAPPTPPSGGDPAPAPPTVEAHGRTYFASPAARFGSAGPVQGGARPNVNRTIEASMLMSKGGFDGQEIERIGYTQNEIESAMSAEHRGIGLQRLCYMTLEAAGRSAPGGISKTEIVERAYDVMPSGRTINAAGFSTVNMPGILGNVARKTLEASYERRAGVALTLCRRKTMTDFKAITSHRMTMTGSYKEVGPGEEFPTAKLGEETWTLSVKKSGLLIELTFEDQVNDDLDAFLDIPNRLGQEYAEYLEWRFWQKVLSGIDTYFTSGKGNRLTTGSVLNIDGLNRATQLFMSMKSGGEGANQRYMSVMGKYLLVPPSLLAKANGLYTATSVNESTNPKDPQPNFNPHSGKFSPITSPYLGGDFKTKVGSKQCQGSDKHWIMAADPASVPAMQVGFLEGKHVPDISHGDVDYRTLGMYWRAWGAFGFEFFDPEHAWVYCEGNA